MPTPTQTAELSSGLRLSVMRLARRLRDLRASVQHVAMSPNNFVIAGRLRLGVDLGTTRI